MIPDTIEQDSYGSNVGSPQGEYLISSYSTLSPTDDINFNHADQCNNQIGPQVFVQDGAY